MENKPYIIELKKLGALLWDISFFTKKIPLILKEYIGLILHPTMFWFEGHAHKKLNQVIFAV